MAECKDCIHFEVCAYERHDLPVCDSFVPAADVAPVRRWIPVTERLPECGKRVLATDGGFVGEFYINKRGQWKRYNVNDYSLLMALDILFWMPLPEPPKEDANAKMQ